MIWQFSTYKCDPLPQEIVEKIIANARKLETKIYDSVSWNDIKGQIIKPLSSFEYFISLPGINFMPKTWYKIKDI